MDGRRRVGLRTADCGLRTWREVEMIGKIALVTGAGSGIGLAVTRTLLREGARGLTAKA